MGPAAKLGLIATMVALVCAVQLFEREMRSRRAAAAAPGNAKGSGSGEVAAGGTPLATLLSPLGNVELPPIPDAPPDETAAPAERTYVVAAGDTLAKIAKKTLGRESAWEDIYAHNRSAIRDPARLQVGTVLRIPSGEPRRTRARELTREPNLR